MNNRSERQAQWRGLFRAGRYASSMRREKIMSKFEVSFYSEETETSDQAIVHAETLEDAEETAYLIKCDDEIIVGVNYINPNINKAEQGA